MNQFDDSGNIITDTKSESGNENFGTRDRGYGKFSIVF
jgi:hypothetical protein